MTETRKMIVMTRAQFALIACAFLLLALSVAYSISKTHDNATSQHNQLAIAVYDTDVLGCYAGNGLRTALTLEQSHLSTALNNVDQLFTVVANLHGLPLQLKEQFSSAAATNAKIVKSAMAFPLRDCAKAYAAIRPPGHEIPQDPHPFGQ